MLVILVTGGRDFIDRAFVWETLDHVHRKRGIRLLRHGAARGADKLADLWAETRGVERDPCPADWGRFGKSAGVLRNGAMLEREPRVDGVVAFPGGRGTSDMIDRARWARIPVYEPLYGAR